MLPVNAFSDKILKPSVENILNKHIKSLKLLSFSIIVQQKASGMNLEASNEE